MHQHICIVHACMYAALLRHKRLISLCQTSLKLLPALCCCESCRAGRCIELLCPAHPPNSQLSFRGASSCLQDAGEGYYLFRSAAQAQVDKLWALAQQLAGRLADATAGEAMSRCMGGGVLS